jgi:hypothetical protein
MAFGSGRTTLRATVWPGCGRLATPWGRLGVAEATPWPLGVAKSKFGHQRPKPPNLAIKIGNYFFQIMRQTPPKAEATPNYPWGWCQTSPKARGGGSATLKGKIKNKKLFF